MTQFNFLNRTSTNFDTQLPLRILYFFALVTVPSWIATSSHAEDNNDPPRMANHFTIIDAQQALNLGPKNLTIYADRPNDPLITNQKLSLQEITFNELPMHLPSIKNGFRYFKNFIHGIEGRALFENVEVQDQAEFWFMALPTNVAVKKAILQMEWFKEGYGGHAQLRFVLDSPIVLISKKGEIQTISGDVVYTLQAIRSINGSQTWGPMTGLTGTFANTYSLASTQHMANIQAGVNFIEQHELNFGQSQRDAMFQYALGYGTQAKERELYNIIFNSCIQAVLDVVNIGDDAVNEWVFNPYSVVKHLNTLKLIKKNISLPSLNKEFNSPVQKLESPENKKMLDYVRANESKITSPIFEDSLRLLAQIILEDRWTLAELELAIESIEEASQAIKANGRDLSTEVLVQKVISAFRKIDPNHPRTLAARSSVLRLVHGLGEILKSNGMQVEDFLLMLSKLNGGL